MPEELKKIIEKIGPPLPEKGVEGLASHAEKSVEASARPAEKEKLPSESSPVDSSPSSIVAITNARQQIQEEITAIEKVLEKDLTEMYLNMSPDKQREFKVKGEETARQINILLHKSKIHIKKIIDLIKKWLSVIPGVNKFFLEQEAKIKADEIMKIKKI